MNSRFSCQEGLSIFRNFSLSDLQKIAKKTREEKNNPQEVTFTIDSTPNYTNVCEVKCSFCAFYRNKEDCDAYTLSVEEVMQHLKKASDAGVSTVLLQGGINKSLKIDYYVDLVKTATKLFPNIHPHFFSAAEIWHCANVSNMSIKMVLEKLWEAGLRTIPGGGAEILSERVRSSISPKKIYPHGWIEIHHLAHTIGYKTTATMMYGHIERDDEIIEHLDVLRRYQDKIPGFTSFIPWSYKPGRTPLGRKIKKYDYESAYLRIIAFSRIYLDNFDHISASWFGEGKAIGVKALKYGADDFGGTLLEENVHKEAGWINEITIEEMKEMIRQAGFKPVQRDTFYKRVLDDSADTNSSLPEDCKFQKLQ